MNQQVSLKTVVGIFSIIGVIGGLWFAWPEYVKQYKFDEYKKESKDSYNEFVALKNQDNEWYRQLGERTAKIEVIVEKNAEQIAQIKGLVLKHQIGHRSD